MENLPILILLFFCLTLFGLYLDQYLKYHHLLEKWQRDYPKDIQSKGLQILSQFYRKAKRILGQAELDSVKTLADARFEARKLEKDYQTQLDILTFETEKNLKESVSTVQASYQKFLSNLAQTAQQEQSANQEMIKQKSNEILEKFEENLSSFLTSSQARSSNALDLEIKAARGLIDTYKTQQLSLIDENIVAILEKTLSLIITQQLPLKDHLDLVMEALEKAKVEKFIV